MSVWLLVCGGGVVGLAQAPPDVLVGVTWSDGTLVSFDPVSGEALQRHVQIDPNQSFVGLAHDRNHGRLYALAQGSHALFTLETETLQLANVVPLRLDAPGPGVTEPAPGVTDVTSLAYDPFTDTLYTTIGHWESYPAGPIWDELARVDPWTGDVTVLGRIDGPWLLGLAYSETERTLYALGVYGAGAWDSPDTTQVFRIDPATAAAESVSVTPYHTMLGMALKEPGLFYSWINSDSRLFAQTDVPALTVATLGSDETAGPIGAMLLRDFDLPPVPPEVPASLAGFSFRGHVTEVSDPFGRIGGQVHKGQLFRGQLGYDPGVPYIAGLPGRIGSYGVMLQTARLGYQAGSYAAWIMNDRLDPADTGPTDEFRLRAYDGPGLVISWTLVDRSGNAVEIGDRLPEDFDLSRWQTNEFSVARYDPCCREPVYRFVGRVDEIRRRSGPLLGLQTRRGQRGRN